MLIFTDSDISRRYGLTALLRFWRPPQTSQPAYLLIYRARKSHEMCRTASRLISFVEQQCAPWRKAETRTPKNRHGKRTRRRLDGTMLTRFVRNIMALLADDIRRDNSEPRAHTCSTIIELSRRHMSCDGRAGGCRRCVFYACKMCAM